MHPFRVFISYSHEDALLQQVIRDHIHNQLACKPMQDLGIRGGSPFHAEIRAQIEHAHVFLPLLTRHSANRPWVNQEIGYAIGNNVPTLPLAVGSIPSGLLGSYQAISVAESLEHVVFSDPYDRLPRFECAPEPEERTRMLVRYATGVTHHGHGRVRHRGAFTSFSIPTAPLEAAAWGDRAPSREDRAWLRRERFILEQHARKAGLSLVIDHPSDSSDVPPNISLCTRLDTLVQFLDDMPDPLIEIAVAEPQSTGENVLILGDWFLAEAVVPRDRGRFRKTVFTRHAPTVLERIREFDRDFAYWKTPRAAALDLLRKRLRALHDQQSMPKRRNAHAATSGI